MKQGFKGVKLKSLSIKTFILKNYVSNIAYFYLFVKLA